MTTKQAAHGPRTMVRLRVGAPMAALPAMLALLLIAGCLAPVAQVGNDPAMLSVAYDAKVTDQQIQQALKQSGPVNRLQVRFDSFLGPFWQMVAYITTPEGKPERLPLAPGQSADLGDGKAAAGRVTFLVPPGKQKVRLVFTATINHSWQDRPGGGLNYRAVAPDGRVIDDVQPDWQNRTEYVQVLKQEREVSLEAAPGGKIDLAPFK